MGFRELRNKVVHSKFCARVAIVQAEGMELFAALKAAEDICLPILIGNKTIIESSAHKANLNNYEIYAAASPEESAALAVQLVREKQSHTLMKGNVTTEIFTKAILHSQKGLRTGSLLSHVCLFEFAENASGFIGVTDSAINIAPDLPAKIAIIHNAITLFHKLGITCPRVAVLAAIEKVNHKMPATLDAALLAEMGMQNKFPNALINGPISLDLALNAAARSAKNFDKFVNSNADILVTPEIVSGNILTKAFIHVAHLPTGGILLGASCPIILLSRSDAAAEKNNSIILGSYLCSIS